MSFDITDRRIADEKLRGLNTNLEQQVLDRVSERGVTWDVSPFLLSVIDMNDGTFIRVNPAWENLLGWSEDEMSGAPFLRFLHPDDVAASNEAFAQVARGEPVLNFVNRYRDKEGGYHWLSWVAVPDNGKLYSTVRDVTAERQAAERLTATQDQLRQAQKMEAVGQLTGGLAHDFNNLLTIIRSSTDFLRRQNLPEEKRARYINAISDTADRAAKLTSQLLAFARRQPLLPTVFDVSAQVDTIAVLIKQLLGGRVSIEVKPCNGACFANADIGQFETALINLAVNARDAMNGEGQLTFQTRILEELPRVRTRGARPGRVVAVSVTDTGEGIDASKLEAIFEPFYTTKEVGKGTGLGLSQVFGFSQQSGGDIAVKSELAKGSTFTLYLPLVTPSIAPDNAETPSQEDARSKSAHCILVVEDNADVGSFSTELLHDLGYKTQWVSSAHEALEALAKDDLAYDLVFTDVIMPGMNGVDLARTIRAKYPGLPVVLTSGYSSVLAEGDHGFQLVHKPYSVESLSRVLRKAIVPRRP